MNAIHKILLLSYKTNHKISANYDWDWNNLVSPAFVSDWAQQYDPRDSSQSHFPDGATSRVISARASCAHCNSNTPTWSQSGSENMFNEVSLCHSFALKCVFHSPHYDYGHSPSVCSEHKWSMDHVDKKLTLTPPCWPPQKSTKTLKKHYYIMYYNSFIIR